MSRQADAGRVIAGSARGIRLRAAPGTRPLGDRVKQSLFAILAPDLPGSRFLDLFAGSGAGGIEALSRGAAGAVFVDSDPQAVAAIKANLATTRLGGPLVLVLQVDVSTFVGRPLDEHLPFDIVLIDPPYADTELLARTLKYLGSPGAAVNPGARVVAKHFWKDHLEARVRLLASEREERFGETALTFYRRRDENAADEESP